MQQAELERQFKRKKPHTLNTDQCRRGHPYTDANTTYQRQRWYGAWVVYRICRTCHTAAELARRHRLRDSAGGREA